MKQNIKNFSVAVSTVVITVSAAIIGYSAVNIFDEYTEKHFAEYAKNSAETLAYQSSAIIEDTKNENPPVLTSLAKATLDNDKNISFIEFADTNENLIFSEKSDFNSL